MSGHSSKITLVIWLTLVAALLFSVVPMPEKMEIGRPLWLALVLTFWAIYFPQNIGVITAGVSVLRKMCCMGPHLVNMPWRWSLLSS